MTAKTVLITGCSSGFGKLAAHTFAGHGWNVVATMRRPENETELADGDNMLVTRLDVTDPASIDEALAAAIERFGGVDVLVNNAGYGGGFIFEQADDSVVRAMFETNVFGTMNVCRAVLPHLRARGEGAVVNVTSMAGMMALPTTSVYTASKFALEGFTEGLAIDYAPLGITVRSVLPGAYPTEFSGNTDNHLDGGDEQLRTLAHAFRNKMDQVVGANPQDSQEVADLIYACATDPDLPTHNPSGADAQMLVGMMAQGTREEFLDQVRAMLAPDLKT